MAVDPRPRGTRGVAECTLLQKRLFSYFARELFPNVGTLYDHFADLSDTITNEMLHLPNLLRRYEVYLQANWYWLFKNAPRRSTERLHLTEIVLILFVESEIEEYRHDFETPKVDSTTDVIVQPVLVATGV